MYKKTRKSGEQKTLFFKQQYNIDKQILLAIYTWFDNFILHFAAIYVDFCVLFSGEESVFFTLYIAFYTTQEDTQISLLKAATATKERLSIWALLRVFLRTSPIKECYSIDLQACPFRHHKYATLFPHQAFLFASLCKFPCLVPNLSGVHNARHIKLSLDRILIL